MPTRHNPNARAGPPAERARPPNTPTATPHGRTPHRSASARARPTLSLPSARAPNDRQPLARARTRTNPPSARAAPCPSVSPVRRARAPCSPSSARASPCRHTRTRTRIPPDYRHTRATDPPRRLAHNALAYGYPSPATATHRPATGPPARYRHAHCYAAARDEMPHASLWSPYWPPSTLPVDTGGGGGPGAPANGFKIGSHVGDDLTAKFKISQRIYTDIFPPPTVVP
jgi:hypothetical protein